MNASKVSLVLPILTITMGVGWLLTTQNVLPGVNWVWVLGLAIIGILTLALGGIDKVTVVVGPFFVAATVFSLLRQTGRIAVDTEIPCLVILGGGLALIARFLPVPPPRWFDEGKSPDTDG